MSSDEESYMFLSAGTFRLFKSQQRKLRWW